ncbi:hypothetical protein B0H66DRAFT_538077 [Apodospora peruviana]|uniref:Uncharacterized protein n=1 Tax=Apodospora peruviana TaxID=516989 RepID=A0AAE0HU77_9PEZI|nr:hypothetical protein B0H66DRAFT_538077 [Apodospora peruviana]
MSPESRRNVDVVNNVSPLCNSCKARAVSTEQQHAVQSEKKKAKNVSATAHVKRTAAYWNQQAKNWATEQKHNVGIVDSEEDNLGESFEDIATYRYFYQFQRPSSETKSDTSSEVVATSSDEDSDEEEEYVVVNANSTPHSTAANRPCFFTRVLTVQWEAKKLARGIGMVSKLAFDIATGRDKPACSSCVDGELEVMVGEDPEDLYDGDDFVGGEDDASGWEKYRVE